MLKTKDVEDMRNKWNESAVQMFVLAASEEDAEEKARMRGAAEQLAICANALKVAQED